ncbi:MAG: NHLP leader peptide family natural product precursor [Alphaproteobacteria bacterium]|nr:NHLP leader peptide family natural product precursor [Alphaproteobacteria bacterium]
MSEAASLHAHAERIIAKAWADDDFKARLLADPAAIAAAEGIEVPAGVKIVVHENKPGELHVVLPAKPSADISDEALDAVVGGRWGGIGKQFDG